MIVIHVVTSHIHQQICRAKHVQTNRPIRRRRHIQRIRDIDTVLKVQRRRVWC